MLPRIEFLDTEAAVLPKHHERPVAANPDLIGVRIRYPQRQTQRIARGDLFGQPRKGNIHKARRMEMRVDKPREAFAVGQHDAPDAARGIRPVVRRFDQHLVSCEARIVIAELPLVRTVTDIGLAVGLLPGIKGVFGRDGIAMAENDGAAAGDPGDPAVAGRIVEDLETQTQRIEDHFEAHQTGKEDGRQPGTHQVTPRAGMPAGIGEKRIDQAENGDDHPLGLHVTAKCREQEKTMNATGINFSARSTAFCGFTAIQAFTYNGTKKGLKTTSRLSRYSAT